ncbi:hypothetical protein D3C74_256900 [compost metagenome]
MPSAPNANRIKVGFGTAANQLLRALSATAREDVVLRNIIRPHGKERDPVHDKLERFAPFVFFLQHRQGAQSNAQLAPVQFSPLLTHYDLDLI